MVEFPDQLPERPAPHSASPNILCKVTSTPERRDSARVKVHVLSLQYKCANVDAEKSPLDDVGSPQQTDAAISSGRVFMINTRAQQKSLHAWIILVIVELHLVQIGRLDGPTEFYHKYSPRLDLSWRVLCNQEAEGFHRVEYIGEIPGFNENYCTPG